MSRKITLLTRSPNNRIASESETRTAMEVSHRYKDTRVETHLYNTRLIETAEILYGILYILHIVYYRAARHTGIR